MECSQCGKNILGKLYLCQPCNQRLCRNCYQKHPEHPITRYRKQMQPQEIAVDDLNEVQEAVQFQATRNLTLQENIKKITKRISNLYQWQKEDPAYNREDTIKKHQEDIFLLEEQIKRNNEEFKDFKRQL